MNSMTGYGFKEAVIDGTQISVEIKSVNNRFLDLGIYLPSFLSPLEQKIRKIVSEKVTRGKIDLSVRINETNSNAKVNIDFMAAKKYFDEFSRLGTELGYINNTSKNIEQIPLTFILSQDGVINTSREFDVDSYWAKIEVVLNEVIENFILDRKREGENLKIDLLEKLSVLEECAAFFKDWQPKMEEKFKEIITNKFNELLSEHVDQNRIMAEVAAMLVKYTINEEIVRLQSHLQALRNEINTNPVPGKKIDFICQEANREINTIGSKNQFTQIGAMVVRAKDALENIREQSKNIE